MKKQLVVVSLICVLNVGLAHCMDSIGWTIKQYVQGEQDIQAVREVLRGNPTQKNFSALWENLISWCCVDFMRGMTEKYGEEGLLCAIDTLPILQSHTCFTENLFEKVFKLLVACNCVGAEKMLVYAAQNGYEKSIKCFVTENCVDPTKVFNVVASEGLIDIAQFILDQNLVCRVDWWVVAGVAKVTDKNTIYSFLKSVITNELVHSYHIFSVIAACGTIECGALFGGDDLLDIDEFLLFMYSLGKGVPAACAEWDIDWESALERFAQTLRAKHLSFEGTNYYVDHVDVPVEKMAKIVLPRVDGY